MRFALAFLFVLALGLCAVHAKPTFKPIEFDGELKASDPPDAKFQFPGKRYTVTLSKDKTYIIDLASPDFDAYLRLLDKGGKHLAEDDDSGGGFNARIIQAIDKDGEYQIVVTSFDGELGKFNLKVREFAVKGEAEPRIVGEEGVRIADKIEVNNLTELNKLGKFYSVRLKKGEEYQIDLRSAAFDAYLYLLDGNSKILQEDDDSGGGFDARIVFRADRDGVYHILAASLRRETGAFTLTVNKKDPRKK